jgi:hypothetical protein
MSVTKLGHESGAYWRAFFVGHESVREEEKMKEKKRKEEAKLRHLKIPLFGQ